MANFIKVTHVNNGDTFVDAEKVLCVQHDDREGANASIRLLNDNCFRVKETPADLLAVIPGDFSAFTGFRNDETLFIRKAYVSFTCVDADRNLTVLATDSIEGLYGIKESLEDVMSLLNGDEEAEYDAVRAKVETVKWHHCPNCKGTGMLDDETTCPCPSCHGRGKVFEP